MNSKELLKVKKKLGKYLKNNGVVDIVLFGSFVKGKALPKDVDVVVIGEKIKIEGFHVSYLSLNDFVVNPPMLVRTILKEGYSLRYNKPFSARFKYLSKSLYKYDLKGLSASEKVKIVNFLRGKKGDKGLVVERGGEWLVNQVFFAPVGEDHVFEKFFINMKVKFKKYDLLMH